MENRFPDDILTSAQRRTIQEVQDDRECTPIVCEGRMIIEAAFGVGTKVNFSRSECEAVRFEADTRAVNVGTTGCGLVVRTVVEAQQEGRI